MSFFRSHGPLVPAWVILSDTSATEIISGNKGGIVVNQLHVANNSGGAVTVVVDCYDTTITTAYLLEPGLSVPDGKTAKIDLDAVPVNLNWSLRVTGANGVHVLATYVRNQSQSDPLPQGRF